MGASCCILASASTSTAESSPTIASPSTAELGSSCCNDPCASTAALGASPSSDASSSTAASASSAAVGASCSTAASASTVASSTAASTSAAEVGASASTAASSTAASSSTVEVGASASTAASSTAPSASTAGVGASYYTDPDASTAALGASTSSAASSSTAASASSAAVDASSSTDRCASTPVMGASASTVASASAASQSYDFFINHRGVDVKRTFARSLYLRLQEKGLRAFLDQPEMQSGYNFPEQIQNVIETASVHVAIFSPQYAESSWCLDELVMMLHSKAPIIPVFYRVTPADARYAKGKYAEDLEKLAEKNDKGMPRHDSNTIEKWRNALSTVADYSGFELQKDCNGDELVLELLDNVVERLSKMVRKPDLYVAEYPTGLDEKLSDFQNAVLLQQPQSGKPQIVGITGLGGVGKTTLAKHFFNTKKSDYTKSCFLSDIKDGSLISLQRNLLKDLVQIDKPIDSVAAGQAMVIKLLKPSNLLTRSAKPVDSVDAGQEMPTKHHESSRALIVLDDVDHEDQITAILPLETLDFLSHSLILITSRNKDVLLRARVAEPSIYVLTGLNTKCSRELFCSHAFSQDYPREGFKFLTDKFLESCNGLPLSLKVYGALLYGKEMSEWKDELERVPDEVKGKLKISYDALNKEEQQVFLDIACFLNGQNRDTAISIWKESGWTGRRGFQKLQDRCLVQVDSWNLIHMHEHLRDLGREIGEKSSPFRFWRWTETVIDDLPQQSHLMVRGLKMDRSDYNNYSDYVLGRIGTKRLRILDTEDDVMESILGMAELPHILWLRWRNCPYSSLPSWMSVKNLRHLEVSKSNLNALWQTENQSQVPLQLRLLDVSGCCELEELPSLETLTSLEELHAYDCVKLNSIRGLEQCAKLRELNVGGCSELEELPTMQTLTSLEEFQAYKCVKLKRIRGLEQCAKLRYLHVGWCSELEELPTMQTLTSLEELHAFHCVKLNRIRGLEHCSRLRVFSVAGCSELEELPTMEALLSMEKFYAGGCVKLKRIRGIWQLRRLRVLNVRRCLELEEVEGVEQCTWLEKFDASGCPKLQCPLWE